MGTSTFISTAEWDGDVLNPITGITQKFISVGVLSPRSSGPITVCEEDRLIDYLYSHYRCDTNRLYLTGLSRGGGGPTIGYASKEVDNSFCSGYAQKHSPAAIVPMSAEITINAPVDTVVADSVRVWGFGGDSDNTGHSEATDSFVVHVNNLAPGLGRFTLYHGGHTGWNNYYTPLYTESIGGVSMNIYQWMLLYSKDTAHVVTTGVVTDSTICVSDTVGANITVPYTATGTYNSGNIFKAQLSTATGSFSTITVIGSITSTNRFGFINCYIPPSMPTGTGYKIRVNASDPHVVGIKSPTSVTINLAANSIAPTADQNITVNTNGTPLTVTEQSAALSRKWKYGTTLGNYNHTIPGETGITYTPNFGNANTFYVVCKSFFTYDSINSNPVKIVVSPAFRKSSTNTTFTALVLGNNITCTYSLTQKSNVEIVLYDIYGRPYANYKVVQLGGTYSHEFNQKLSAGIYIAAFKLNGQTVASQQILIGQ